METPESTKLIDEKKTLYRQYINEHVANVKYAFNMHGRDISDALGLTFRQYFVLSTNINVHDASKYSKHEFDAYRQYFYPISPEEKQQSLLQFSAAWKHHYQNNPHHPEYWINASGEPEIMQSIYIAEMVLDWEAMSIKFGGDPLQYYNKDGKNKKLHPFTRQVLESVLEKIYGRKIC